MTSLFVLVLSACSVPVVEHAPVPQVEKYGEHFYGGEHHIPARIVEFVESGELVRACERVHCMDAK